MNIRLTQLDGKLPNLALMKLAYYHRTQGDRIYFTRKTMRELWESDYDIVYGSCIFSFSQTTVNRFQTNFPNAIIGGSGTSNTQTVEDIIGESLYEYENYDYSIYPDFDHSIGFSQRGCRLKCPFCIVPKKEGSNVVVNRIYDIWRKGPYPKKIHLLDNDFFGQEAWRERCNEIIEGKFKVCFNQGINIRLFNEEQAGILAKIPFYDDQFKQHRIYTAWDNRKDERRFLNGIDMLLNAGIKPQQIMVYMLIGYWKNETWEDIWHRFNTMIDLGLLPYPMLYDKSNKELVRFQKWVIKRYYKVVSFDDYKKKDISRYYSEGLQFQLL